METPTTHIYLFVNPEHLAGQKKALHVFCRATLSCKGDLLVLRSFVLLRSSFTTKDESEAGFIF